LASRQLTYHITDGHIDDWLIAGPWVMPPSQAVSTRNCPPDLTDALESPMLDQTIKPAEGSPLVLAENTALRLYWRHYRCLDDHVIDFSNLTPDTGLFYCWAYANLRVSEPTEATLCVTASASGELWLNGEHIERWDLHADQSAVDVSLNVQLHRGHNALLLRLDKISAGNSPVFLNVSVMNTDMTKARVTLPTRSPSIKQRNFLERLFASLALERDTYSAADRIVVRCANDVGSVNAITARVQTPDGRIYLEANPVPRPSQSLDLLGASQLPDGPMELRLMPPAVDYYEHNLRVDRRLSFHVLKNRYSHQPYGTYETRRQEALADVASREDGVYSEIAKMESGRWNRLNPLAIRHSLERVWHSADDEYSNLLGLLAIAYRYFSADEFPDELRIPLKQAIQSYPARLRSLSELDTSSHCMVREIMRYVCEILGGQLYSDEIFSSEQLPNPWQRIEAEQLALCWLQDRANHGWPEWNSHAAVAQQVLALSHLVDLAENAELCELAAVVLDKLLFTLAVNSYRGVFGSTHARTESEFITGARLEPTAGISRLLWGLGVFNQHTAAVAGLACSSGYQLPSIIAQIATDLPEEMWARERHSLALIGEEDPKAKCGGVHKVTYRTPDYMLASAHDHRPGEMGNEEHIWQATLGPDAVVFVNQPAWMSTNRAHSANFWRGNYVLPRVLQWRDVLIAIHEIPEDAPLCFTHAYFPTAAFDEYSFRGKWAFARKDDGYLALWASQRPKLITRGQSAYRELRAFGPRQIWLCQMGRAARDGTFAEFQRKVVAPHTTADSRSVRYHTLNHQLITFGWEDPLLVDGHALELAATTHYENPYCHVEFGAPNMDIRYQENVLRLRLSE